MLRNETIKLFLLVFIGFSAFALPAYSQEIWKSCKWLEPDSGVSASNPESVGKIFSICDEYKGFTNKAVKCISRIFLQATSEFITDFKPYYDDLLKAVLLLFVVIFGIRTIMGDLTPQYLRYEAPLFLLKFGVVMYFINDIIPWYTYAVCGTGDMLETITANLAAGLKGENGTGGSMMMSMACTGQLNPGACVNLSAPTSMADYTPLTNKTNGVWNFLDCLLGSFISFSPSGLAPAETSSAQVGVVTMLPLGMSAFGIIIASSLSGYIGMAVFFAGITSLISLLFSIFKAAFQFLVAMIGISFYFTISGFAFLCLPFRATNRFFWAWLGGVTQYMMLPMILVVFLTLTIWVYDWALFRSEQSLMRELFQKDEICPEDIKTLNESGFLKFDVMSAVGYAKNSSMKGELPAGYQALAIEESANGVAEYEAQRQAGYTYNQLASKLPGLNIKSHPAFKGDVTMNECMKDEACAKDLQEMFMTGLLGSLITLAAITYVIMSFIDMVPSFAFALSNLVAGNFGTYTVPYGDMKAPFEKNINRGVEALKKKATELRTDQTVMGPASQKGIEEFVRQAPQTFTTNFAGDNIVGDIVKGAFESGKDTPPPTNPLSGRRGK